MLYQERDAGLRLVVQRQVYRVKAGIFELQLLDVDDEVARAEMQILRQHYFNRYRWEIGHDRTAIGVDKIQAEVVFAFVAAEKGHAQRNGTLRMNGRKLLGVNRIKSPKQVKLAVIIGRRVAEDSHLNIH